MRSSWVKLGRRYDPDQYWAGQHLKVTLSHNAEQATEEQGRGGREKNILSGKIRTTRTPVRRKEQISGTFWCCKTDKLCFDEAQKRTTVLLKCPKTHSWGRNRSKGKASSQQDPEAKHSSYLSSAALCKKVLALVQHTRRCHCVPREPYVSNLPANPCSERPRWCSASDALCILMSNLSSFRNKVLPWSEIARKTPKRNKTGHKLLSLCCFI